MGDDWDLQAVVRSCTTATTSSSTATVDDSFSCFSPLVVDQKDPLLSFPDLFETRTATEELEELCKPFFPKSDPLSPQRISTSLLALGGVKDQPQQQQTPQQQKQIQRPLSGSGTAAAAATNTTHSQTPRSKRRKNQQKRVVCQVPAEGLSSDMWAWRKYGQKPIKGSPYPRGYYRCSSSKGCLARKQVERSCSDPGIFIITYTAEHNHPIPTHRNSLAGSTRNKFPPPQNTGVEPETSTGKPSCSSPASTTTAGLSPMTPSTAAMEDELLQETKPESREDDEEEMVEDNEDDDLLIPDMLMGDDLFNDLGELAGPTSATASSAGPGLDDCYPDNLPATFPPPWFAHNAATAAGGG